MMPQHFAKLLKMNMQAQARQEEKNQNSYLPSEKEQKPDLPTFLKELRQEESRMNFHMIILMLMIMLNSLLSEERERKKKIYYF